jgi:hypothetical protein
MGQKAWPHIPPLLNFVFSSSRPVKQLDKPQKICYVSTVFNISRSGPAGWPRLAGKSGFRSLLSLCS